MTTRKEIISHLTCEVLRLRLRNAHVSTTGKKSALVERLLQHEDSLKQGTSGLANFHPVIMPTAASDDSSDSSESETPSSGEEAPPSSAAVGTGSVPPPSTLSEPPEQLVPRDTATNLVSTTRSPFQCWKVPLDRLFLPPQVLCHRLWCSSPCQHLSRTPPMAT